MTITPTISVVIPVKNEAKGIASCLQSILDQSVPVHEILVIDSGSTDGTQEIVRRFEKTRLLTIPPEQFNHGDTRNLGVKSTTGELILFTVGDARAANNDWIKELLRGFLDESVAAVTGSQVVPEDAQTNPVEWFRPQSEPHVRVCRFASAEAFDNAPAKEKMLACGWDDVTAIYRRRVLEHIPFRRVVYGEDIFFAIDAYREGHALAYNPAARVYHHHNENYATLLKRTIAVATMRYTLLGYETPQHEFLPEYFMVLARLVRNRSLTWGERFKWARYNLDAHRAFRDGIGMFHEAKAKSGDSLATLQARYCGTPPLPLKPRSVSGAQ